MVVEKHLKIGDISKQTNVAVGALRYYEAKGLLHSERGENGYRYYPSEVVKQVQFIKKVQSLGFSLEDIGAVLNLHHQGNVPYEIVQSILQEKITQLETQIKEMMIFKTQLEKYCNTWTGNHPHPKPGDICPLIEMFTLS